MPAPLALAEVSEGWVQVSGVTTALSLGVCSSVVMTLGLKNQKGELLDAEFVHGAPWVTVPSCGFNC